MKVLFISRSTLYTVRGGDTRQVDSTAEALRQLGVDVDIRLAHERIDYAAYDILHFFNLIRPADILQHARKSKLPYVVSTIYVDYSIFDQLERGGFQGTLSKALGKHGSEYAKTLLRWMKGQDVLASPAYLLGHKRAMRTIVRDASMLLPNSENEAQRVTQDLNIQFDYAVVPNAVDTTTFFEDTQLNRDPSLVLCVGQIEGRKNQLRLIEAVEELDVDLALIGKPSPNNVEYYEQCKSRAGKRVEFIDYLDQQELRNWYNKAAVHALPSWFETTGLTSLEAAACGCSIVVGEIGDTRAYFEGVAEFCDPGDTKSIRNAIERALKKKSNEAFVRQLKEQYTWQRTAEKTLEAYKRIVG